MISVLGGNNGETGLVFFKRKRFQRGGTWRRSSSAGWSRPLGSGGSGDRGRRRKRRSHWCGGGGRRGSAGFADHDGEAAEDDDAAMDGGVADAGGHEIADEDSGRAHGDHVWRADAGGHIRDAGGREHPDQHGGAARRKDWSADMRHDARDHRANVHIRHSRGRRHLSFASPWQIAETFYPKHPSRFTKTEAPGYMPTSWYLWSRRRLHRVSWGLADWSHSPSRPRRRY